MKAKYREYDYESTYNQSIDDLDEWFAERMLGKARGVYATKEITFGPHMDIEIYPEFTKREVAELGLPEVNRAKERDRMRVLDGRKARVYFRRLCEQNFADGDLWITLTYSQEPESIKEAIKHFQNFIRNINGKRHRMGLENAKYVYTTERVSEDGETVRVHHHLLMDGALDSDTVLSLWKHGGRNRSRYLETDENGIAGAAEYMAKPAVDEKRRKHEKRWTSSRNLAKPEEHKHHQTRSSTVTKMIKNHDCIKECVENAKLRSGALRYKGYICTDSEVRYNEVNGGYYIKVHLRREKNESKDVYGSAASESKLPGTGREKLKRTGRDRR